MRQEWGDDRLDLLDQKVEDGFQRMDQRFNGIDHRFELVDQQFESVNQRLERVEGKIDSLGSEINLRFDALHRAMMQFCAVFSVVLAGMVTTLGVALLAQN